MKITASIVHDEMHYEWDVYTPVHIPPIQRFNPVSFGDKIFKT